MKLECEKEGACAVIFTVAVLQHIFFFFFCSIFFSLFSAAYFFSFFCSIFRLNGSAGGGGYKQRGSIFYFGFVSFR